MTTCDLAGSRWRGVRHGQPKLTVQGTKSVGEQIARRLRLDIVRQDDEQLAKWQERFAV